MKNNKFLNILISLLMVVICISPLNVNATIVKGDGISAKYVIDVGGEQYEVTDKDTKIIKCYYKDFSNHYDGISIQVVFNVENSINENTFKITPQFYFPDSVVSELIDRGILNNSKQYLSSNNKWKSVYDLLGSNSTTFINNSPGTGDTSMSPGWPYIISELNYQYGDSNNAFGVTAYNYNANQSTIKNVQIRPSSDNENVYYGDAFIDHGDVVCPLNIAVKVPLDGYELDKQLGFQMGYYSQSEDKYFVDVIIPEAYKYDLPLESWNDTDDEGLYIGNGNWDNGEDDDACYRIGSNYENWADNCAVDSEYGILYLHNTYYDKIKYTEEEKKAREEALKDAEDKVATEGPDALITYCTDPSIAGKYKIGSAEESLTAQDNRNQGTVHGSCYYQVFNKQGSIIDEIEYTSNILADNKWHICENEPGQGSYSSCPSIYGQGENIGGGVYPILPENIDGNSCESFYGSSSENYYSSSRENVCQNKKGSYYYCACKFVGKCDGGATYSWDDNTRYFDCSVCTGYVDPCAEAPEEPEVEIEYICWIIGPKTWPYIKMIYNLIKYSIPALIVVLGIVDFMKVVLSGEEKDMKASGVRFLKRIIAGIIFLLLPVLLGFLFNIVGFSEDCLQQFFEI